MRLINRERHETANVGGHPVQIPMGRYWAVEYIHNGKPREQQIQHPIGHCYTEEQRPPLPAIVTAICFAVQNHKPTARLNSDKVQAMARTMRKEHTHA